MKNLKVLAFAMVAAFALVSCNSVEKILPKKDGTWNNTSVDSKVYIDDVLFLELTLTDSLGSSTFEKDGTGESFDASGTSTGTFTWTATDEEVSLTQDGTTDTFEVLESSKSEQTWYQSETEVDNGVTTRTEVTLKIEKAD